MCSECQAARLDVPSLSTAKKSKKRAGPAKSKTVKAKTSRKKSSKTKTVKIEVERKTDLAEKEESEPLESPIETLEVSVHESLEPTESDADILEPSEDKLADDSTAATVSEPVRATETIQPVEVVPEVAPEPMSEVPPQASFSRSAPSEAIEDHLGLVYVNTPVPDLIKQKIEIDFESFPVISIGRSPENVVVIQDAGVSRFHAELSREGNRIILKDLGSSNGTYVYDGKEFHRIENTADIKPNNLLKLGTGTILRLVAQ